MSDFSLGRDPNLRLREATEAEADMIAGLVRAAFEEYRGRLDPPSGAHNERAEHVCQKMLRASAVVAEEGGQAVGCVFYEPLERGLYFGRLSVLPSHRHRGIGLAMVRHIEARAHALQFPPRPARRSHRPRALARLL